MRGMSALFPKEIPDALLAGTLAHAFQLQPGQIFIYSDLEDLSVMEGRAVAVSCRHFRHNDMFPSMIELVFRDASRSWDARALLGSLCAALNTWCLYEDDTLKGANPYEYYRLNRDGSAEKGLVAQAMLISDEEMAELSLREAEEVKAERHAHGDGWWHSA